MTGLAENVEELQKLVREQHRQIADLTQQREILKKRWELSARGLERYKRIEEMKDITQSRCSARPSV